MRERLDALRDVPPKTVAVDEVVDRPERNEGVVTDPGRLDEDEEEDRTGEANRGDRRLSWSSRGRILPCYASRGSLGGAPG